MDLEVPVLARNIPGNAAVIQHGVTGLLFSDPQVTGVPGMVCVCICLNILHVFASFLATPFPVTLFLSASSWAGVCAAGEAAGPRP